MRIKTAKSLIKSSETRTNENGETEVLFSDKHVVEAINRVDDAWMRAVKLVNRHAEREIWYAFFFALSLGIFLGMEFQKFLIGK